MKTIEHYLAKSPVSERQGMRDNLSTNFAWPETHMADSTPTPTPAPTPTSTAPATINFEDFAKLDLRVATVLECVAHPNADKLLLLKVDIAGEARQICAGLRAHYQPEQLVGKQIIVVANLAPRQMRGQISQGMLLAATDPATSRVIFVTPSEAVGSGAKVS
jgi:methionyl-tRNA synthetase